MALTEFKQVYFGNLEVDPYYPCIPDCFADLCSGWTQETFRQVIMTMTRKGAAPIKLWFDSPEEMNVLSNKRQAIQDIFKTIDSGKVGRIDTMELFAPILISIQGKWETILANTMVIFGFGNEGEFSRDEFHFFLDCLFRGLFKLLIPTTPSSPKARNRRQPHPGRKVPSADIERLVSQVFPSNIDIVERSDFIELMSSNKEGNPVKEVCELIQYFHK
jgi:Ca2+-binding EF-hand superfamily protein